MRAAETRQAPTEIGAHHQNVEPPQATSSVAQGTWDEAVKRMARKMLSAAQDGRPDVARRVEAGAAKAVATLDRDTLERAAAALLIRDAQALNRERSRAAEDAARSADREAQAARRQAWLAEHPEEVARLAEVAARNAGHGKAVQAKRRNCECDLCAEWWREQDEMDDRWAARIDSIVTEFTEVLRAEWTADLLGSTFAVGDGRLVTWGSATVADHRARIAMLSKMASGTLETAAMHRRAVDDLEAAGATTLASLTEGEVAS